MRRLVTLLFASTLAFSPALASEESGSPRVTKPTTPGQITFSTQAIDFGASLRGQKLKHSFTFTNTGKGPLIIQGVHATCGCIATEVTKGQEYAPGQSGAIDVTLDTTNFSGNLVKAITVMTNERPARDHTLTARALVREEIIVEPPVIDFGDVMSSRGGKQTAMVRATPGNKVEVHALKYNESIMKVTLDKGSNDWLLAVELRPDLPPGFIKETISIKNTSSALPDLPLLVRANVAGNILASPKYLEFGAVPREDKVSRGISLESSSAFEIRKITSELSVNGTKWSNPDSIVRATPPAGGAKTAEVNIELVHDGKAFGSAHGKVIIETDDPRQKTVSVDFYAFFK
jgi:hypothetical protein